MAIGRRLLIAVRRAAMPRTCGGLWPTLAAAMVLLPVLTRATAQPPGATTEATRELPEAVRTALLGIQDGAFSFDQPGFYAVVEFVATSAYSPGHRESPQLADDWRALLERPGSFRGRPVVVTGRVGRNKDPYSLPERPDVGQLWQLELQRPDQPLTCTVICTRPVGDIAVGSEITVCGYFVMIRQFYGASGRPAHAALLVAPAPTQVTRAAPRSGQADSAAALDWRWMVLAVALAVVVLLFILRSTRRPRAGRGELPQRARRPAPLDLSQDLAAWADEPRSQPDQRDTEEAP